MLLARELGPVRSEEAGGALRPVFTTPHPKHYHVSQVWLPTTALCPLFLPTPAALAQLPSLEGSLRAFLFPCLFTPCRGKAFSRHLSDLVSSVVKWEIKPNASPNCMRCSMLGPQLPLRILPTYAPAYTWATVGPPRPEPVRHFPPLPFLPTLRHR